MTSLIEGCEITANNVLRKNMFRRKNAEEFFRNLDTPYFIVPSVAYVWEEVPHFLKSGLHIDCEKMGILISGPARYMAFRVTSNPYKVPQKKRKNKPEKYYFDIKELT
jgi:predicted RNA-binding protein associated with RNAse of E/G family